MKPLCAYCQSYARWRMAEESLAKMRELDPVTFGLMVKTRNGVAVQNPLVLTAVRAAADMVRYASEFGFTPAARARIAAGFAGGEAPSKFDGLLAG